MTAVLHTARSHCSHTSRRLDVSPELVFSFNSFLDRGLNHIFLLNVFEDPFALCTILKDPSNKLDLSVSGSSYGSEDWRKWSILAAGG